MLRLVFWLLYNAAIFGAVSFGHFGGNVVAERAVTLLLWVLGIGGAICGMSSVTSDEKRSVPTSIDAAVDVALACYLFGIGWTWTSVVYFCGVLGAYAVHERSKAARPIERGD